MLKKTKKKSLLTSEVKNTNEKEDVCVSNLEAKALYITYYTLRMLYVK